MAQQVALSPKAARKVARAVGRVLRQPESPGPGRSGSPINWNPGVLRAMVTTAIPTGTVASPSILGRVTVQSWDPASATNSASTTLVNVRCCNDHTLTASIAAGKAVKVAWIDGDFWLVSADC